MPVFSKEGIKLLTNLKDDLIKLRALSLTTKSSVSAPISSSSSPAAPTSISLESKEEKKSHSAEMLEKSIELVTDFIEHNDEKWIKANQSLIRDKVAFIDNGTFSYVPEVFNEQTEGMAKVMLRRLSQFHPETHLAGVLSSVIKAVVSDPSRFVTVMISQIQFRLSVYLECLDQHNPK